ncbi:MAG TPA: 50S ribosomal protein L25 [Actinomycetota bacterium]|nr:50S ribosomal protein L25 [Actinomycetota bacterium]
MELKLKAERREGTGKGVARKLRASGRVPAVLYGQGVVPVAVSVDARELFHALHTAGGANVLVDLVLDGKELLTLPREVQRDHIKGRYVHVDFLAIRRDEKVKVDVPVRVVGASPGVKAGGLLEHHLWELHVECLPKDVPDGIEADASSLEIGDGLRVGDIPAPSGVTILTNPEETVVTVATPQILKVEAELEEVLPEGEEAVEGAPEVVEAPPEPAEEGGEG